MISLSRIAFTLARKPYQIGCRLTDKNGDFGAISVQRSEIVPRQSLKRRVTYQIVVHTIKDSFSCWHEQPGIVEHSLRQFRPQSLCYPVFRERATDALEDSSFDHQKPESENPGSGLIAPASSCLVIWPREVPEAKFRIIGGGVGAGPRPLPICMLRHCEGILPCSHIVTIYSFQRRFFSSLDSLINVFTEESNSKGLFKEAEKENI